MTHCLETGGKHVEPKHFRLMMACAEICRTATHFILLSSPHHKHTCRECAEICHECAKDCERLGDMKECVEGCNRCAESCEKMATCRMGRLHQWANHNLTLRSRAAFMITLTDESAIAAAAITGESRMPKTG